MLKLDNMQKKILEILSDIYIFITIILFPLMVDSTGFFKILECKWHCYLVIASTYIVASILIVLYFLIFKKDNIFKQIKLNKIHLALLAFLLVNILSTFLSPYFKYGNLFVGIGRGEGLIMMSLYTLSFLLVSLFGKFKKIYITYFSISSILLNTVAILQYIGFNPFNMYQGSIGTHNVSFMTTIGNIDSISALYTMLLTVSFGAYVFLEEDKKFKIIHAISVLFGFFIIGIINVDSGKLAFLATFVLTFPFLISTNKRLSRSITMLATILLGYCINVIINPEYHYGIGLDFYWQFNYIVVAFLIVIAILLFLAKYLNKVNYDISKDKKKIRTIYACIVLCGILGIVGIYLIDIPSGMLHELHEMLHGNFKDEYGTYRVFLWKRTLTLVPEYPILGSGPDTFAVRFMSKFSSDVASIGSYSINDTAANVYLTMLINLGFLGLGTYMAFVISNIVKGIKKINSESAVLLLAIVCFLIQDFFNLWVVIITPIYWLLLAIHSLSINKNE